ncbi:hypothetical protein BVRB_1g003400 [Beta vulgaris subsp. vulgaris]|nr:hypothetical protein BVRB_1g003400 [Beta vulgaris subsp. vulgaris]
MIYRKWSLLSSTGVIAGGIVGAVFLGNLLFVNDPLMKPAPKKQSESSSK